MILDIIIAVIGWFFLFMALTQAGKDAFGFRLGLVVFLSLAALYLWRKIREIRHKSVRTNWVNIVLFAAGVFFLGMGVTDIGKESFGVKLGFGLAVPLLLCFLWRKIRDVKRLDAGEETSAWGIGQSDPVRTVPRPGAEAEQAPMTICPHCGAPGRGNVCSYCGLSKEK